MPYKAPTFKKRTYLYIGIFIVATIFAIFSHSAQAATITWTGGGGDNTWSSSTNWTPANVPNATDTVQFTGSSTKSVTIDMNVTVQGITVSSTYATGTITQGTSTVTVTAGTGFNIASGTWVGGTGVLTVSTSSFSLTGGYFSAPSSTGATTSIWVARNLTISGGTFSATNATTTFFANGSSDNSTITCTGTLGGTVVIKKTTPTSITTNVTVASGCTIDLGTSPTVTLAGSGLLTNNGTINASGTFTVTGGGGSSGPGPGTGGITNNGTIAHSGAVWDFNDADFDQSSTATTTYSGTNITLERNFTYRGGSSFSGITFTLDGNSGSDDALIACSATFGGSITINKTSVGATSTLMNNCTVQGNFIRTAGVLNGSSSAGVTLSIQGDFSATSSNTLGDSNLTFALTGTGTQFVTSTATAANLGGPFQINKSSGEARLSTNLTTSSTCTVATGTLNFLGNNFTCGSTFSVNSSGTLKLFGSESITAPTLNTSSTVLFVGNGDGASNNYTMTSLSSSYSNLTVSSTDGTADTFMLGATTSVNGDLVLNAGTFDASSTGNFGLSVFGNWTALSTSTFQSRGGTVTLGATSTKTLTTAGKLFNNLTINATSATINLGDALVVSSTLTISTGTLDVTASNYQVTTGGSFLNTGVFNARAGTLLMSAQSGSPTLTPGSTLASLTINATGTTITLGAALTTSSTLTITTGTLDVSGSNYQVTVGGSLLNTGIFNARAGTLVMSAQSGSPTLTVSSTLSNLTINATGTTVTLGTNITASGTITFTTGTLDTSSGNNYGITLSGNWTNNSGPGTFIARSGTVTFDTTGTSTITGTSTFNNFSVTTAGKGLQFPAGSTQTISGTWTITGTSGNTVNLRSSNSGTQWNVNPTAVSVSFADAQDSNNTGTSITCLVSSGCVNSGNNTGWTFAVAVVSGGGGSSGGNTPQPSAAGAFSLTINNGAAETTSTKVYLFFVGGNDSYYVDFGENSSFVPNSYTREAHGMDILHPYVLSSSLGTKTVYARFFTQSLSTPSPVFSSKILLKQIATLLPPSPTSTPGQALPPAQTPPATNTPAPQHGEVAPFVTPLYLGLKSNAVRNLQTILGKDREVYPEGLVTGYFGLLTKKAVRRFQCKYNILCNSADKSYGYVGPKTRARLNEIINAQNQGATTQNIPALQEQVRLLQLQLNELLRQAQNR